jgi:hypothetical protein
MAGEEKEKSCEGYSGREEGGNKNIMRQIICGHG